MSKLTGPIYCTDAAAWLGDGFYFWYYESDAIYWGMTKKIKRTGSYDIYSADVDISDVFDTVFNRDHYEFWVEKIERFAAKFTKKSKVRPTLVEINEYFKENGIWNDISGIMFQDIPERDSNTLVSGFYYKKRIQLGVFKSHIISNFAHYFTGQ